MYDAVADDYCYPGTTILKNKLELQDSEELAAFEAEVSDARADEEAPAGSFDLKHFKAIHQHLFQDVYDWAGKIRTVRISKDGSMFCFPENIETQAQKLVAQLRKDQFLTNLSVEVFAESPLIFYRSSTPSMRSVRVTVVPSCHFSCCWRIRLGVASIWKALIQRLFSRR